GVVARGFNDFTGIGGVGNVDGGVVAERDGVAEATSDYFPDIVEGLPAERAAVDAGGQVDVDGLAIAEKIELVESGAAIDQAGVTAASDDEIVVSGAVVDIAGSAGNVIDIGVVGADHVLEIGRRVFGSGQMTGRLVESDASGSSAEVDRIDAGAAVDRIDAVAGDDIVVARAGADCVAAAIHRSVVVAGGPGVGLGSRYCCGFADGISQVDVDALLVGKSAGVGRLCDDV